MTPRLGLATIGQTPRPDLEAAFRRHAPAAEILTRGALDGLAESEISDLAADKGRYPLHTRLASGKTSDIQLRTLAPLVAERARELAATGADLVVVVCAGGFPDVDCPAPVLLPGRLVPAVVAALSKTGRVGLVTPVRGQAEAARDKWKEDGFSPKVAWASPFRHDEISDAARQLSDPTLDLVVLDCMGHDEGYRTEFSSLCSRPVLLAQTLVARIAGEVLAGCRSDT